MLLSALALVLVAALLHAVWNIAAKKAGGNHHFALMGVVMMVVLWLPAALWFGLQDAVHWGWRTWAVMLTSALVHVAYFTILLTGYRKSDLTVVYPVARGFGPLLSSLGAVVLLQEPMSWQSAAGVLAVCGGVFMLAGGPRLLHIGADPRVLAGVRWGALTGTFIAGYTLIDGYAVKVLLIGPVVVDYMCNLLRLPFLLPASLHDRAGFVQAWRAQWKYALVVAILGPLGYIMVLYAMTLAPLSHVAPARELSMLFAALLGGQLLGEGDRGLRLAGAALIAAGVMALALA